MVLLNGEALSKAFGTKQLFKHISLSLAQGERVGLIGANGCGKSTLLKILARLEKADEGTLSYQRGLKMGYLPQSCECPDKTPLEILLEALEKDPLTPEYDRERVAQTWLSKLGFVDVNVSAASLSGGWKKRVLLAKELISAPDLLLLDEPTNHLDLEGILWLEKFLKREAPTYLLVSHDRYFLQHTTNRIIEMGSAYPKGIFASNGSYTQFLAKKEEFLQGQLEQERSLASKARKEQEWLRSNPKARTTKSQARIDQAQELLEDLADVRKRNQKQAASLDFTSSERATRKLVVAKNITKQMGEKVLFRGLDFTLSPGTRIGLMGPNGSGKTTLLRMLAGEILPDQGTLKRADGLRTVYFDQHRNALPDTLTLKEALCPHGEFVRFRGQAIHVNGWCKRFLFSPDFLGLPLSKLSGGERARLTIAHLMLQPADLLLLDEPTNDLDIATLETLETSLMDFPGAVVLITHDRCMLERICNAFLPCGNPAQTELFATYSQWEQTVQAPEVKPKKAEEKPVGAPLKSKLSYAEKKEYEQIEGKLVKLEEKMKELTHLLENQELIQDSQKFTEICQAITLTQTQIEQLYLRWEELSVRSIHM